MVRKRQHSSEKPARAEWSGLFGMTRGVRLPYPRTARGVFPYWSTAARAQRAAKIWGHGLHVEFMSLDAWRDRDLPDAGRGGYMIGINWSGPRLVGWSFTPGEVLNRLAAAD